MPLEMYFSRCPPVRKFNDQSLFDDKGQSIVAKLAKNCKMIIIEDVDLTANHLARHIKSHCLDCIASAVSVSSRYSSQVLAVSEKQYKTILPGVQIC